MIGDATVLDALAVELNSTEVWRALGVPEHGRRSVGTARRIEALMPSAFALLQPRGAWRIVGREDAARAGMARPSEEVGIAVCTIGDALERESAERVAAGDLLGGLVLDAMGSAAAEAAADALNAQLCEFAQAKNRHASPRESPGYGAWDVASQKALLALLPTSRLGISLTEGGMMVPRKSVSFAARIVPERSGTDFDGCARCGRQDCPHRRSRLRRNGVNRVGG